MLTRQRYPGWKDGQHIWKGIDMTQDRDTHFDTDLVSKPDCPGRRDRPASVPIVQSTNDHSPSSRELSEGFRARHHNVYMADLRRGLQAMHDRRQPGELATPTALSPPADETSAPDARLARWRRRDL